MPGGKTKRESGGVKSCLELRGSDQLREDVVEVVHVGQLTSSTNPIQQCVLNLTDQEVDIVEHRVRYQSTEEPYLNVSGGFCVSLPR